MTMVEFQSTSRRGIAAVDTSRLVAQTDGRLLLVDTGTGRLVPVDDEELDALRGRFGNAVELAQNAVRALA